MASSPLFILLGTLGLDETARRLALFALEAFMLAAAADLLRPVVRSMNQTQYFADLSAAWIFGQILGRFDWFRNTFFPASNLELIHVVAVTGRQFHSFKDGLELDPSLIWKGKKQPVVIAMAAMASAALLGVVAADFLRPTVYPKGNKVEFRILMTFLMTNTESAVLARLVTEHKLGASDFGQMVIASALFYEFVCLLGMALVFSANLVENKMLDLALWPIRAFAFVALIFFVVVPVFRWMRRRSGMHTTDMQVCVVLVMVIIVSAAGQLLGFDGMLGSIAFGVLFPREFHMAVKLADNYYYLVRIVLLPIVLYMCPPVIGLIAVVGKLAGAVAAARFYRMPLQEGLLMGYLLNVRGNADIILLYLSRANGFHMLDTRAAGIMVYAIFVISVPVAPISAAVLKYVRKQSPGFKHAGIEWEEAEAELRMLTCVHSLQALPSSINIMEACRDLPLSVYMMNLIEYNERTASPIMYIRRSNDVVPLGDTQEIANTIDAYVHNGGIQVRLTTTISYYRDMHEDVCRTAAELCASIVILPFHKFLGVDGKMHTSKAGYRMVNQGVLKHVSCSVGILVDRGLGGTRLDTAASALNRVAVLFFGGPDDREAVAFGSRFAKLSTIAFSLIRFFPEEDDQYNTTISLEEESSPCDELEKHLDDRIVNEFRNRYTGIERVTYQERFVSMGEDTLANLLAVEVAYTLLIVGRGEKGSSPIVDGLRNLEECPELGPVEDLLASSENSNHCSVLIIRQYRSSNQTSKP
ncbi:hypothetical protein AMTRI_Chr01g110580 [Amborella trichopoda]